MSDGAADPPRDCPLCPRLAEFRDRNRAAWPAWHNAPVPSFGPLDSRLLVVGLGPGLRGANRSGRPFTGDFAGDLLYPTLAEFGFARGAYRAGRDDGPWREDDLTLVDARVTNAVRCVPPQNKPLPVEIARCRPYLAAELAAMNHLRAVLALGRIAHDAIVAALGLQRSVVAFAHGTHHALPGGTSLFDCYHCSRYNVNTGRLTPEMFRAVIAEIRRRLPPP